jgi:hypothetical protein
MGLWPLQSFPKTESCDTDFVCAQIHRWHLIRVNHERSIYEEDETSKRLSVLVIT